MEELEKDEETTKDPAFLLYSSDFLTGCAGLTMEERGQYITLMCLQHQKGHLPEKTIRLSVGIATVDVMEKFIQDEDGNFYNKRLEETIIKRAKFAESRRANGAKGGRPKKEEKPSGSFLLNLPENENEIENINEFNNEYKKVFGKIPAMDDDELLKLNNILLNADYKKEIPLILLKLAYLKFDKIDFVPSVNWILKENNFQKMYNGEFDKMTKYRKPKEASQADVKEQVVENTEEDKKEIAEIQRRTREMLKIARLGVNK